MGTVFQAFGDPGTNQAGLSLFVDQQLVRAALIARPKDAPSGPNAAKKWAVALGLQMGRQILRWLSEFDQDTESAHLDELVMEYQQIYKGGASRTVNPKDVIVNTLQAGVVIGAACMIVQVKSSDVREPGRWKGQRKKNKTSPLIIERLSSSEIAVLDTLGRSKRNHNVLDAVGIGLAHNGRLR